MTAMEDVLSYSRYSEVICIHISCDGDVRTYRSLNKFISVEPIHYHSGKKVRSCHYLPDGFGPHPKYKGDLPAATQIPANVVSFFTEIRQDLMAILGQSFAESQFMVIAPIEWRNFNYKVGMRLIFKRTGWLLDGDQSNRMIITDFLKGFVYYLQEAETAPEFERDRRYIYCSLNRNSSELFISLTHYQMFNLKGLNRISMKLATEDTLLTPNILDHQQIKIPYIDNLIKPSIRSLIADRIPLFVMARGSPVSRELSGYEDLTSRIVNDIMNVLNLISTGGPLPILDILPAGYKKDGQLGVMLAKISCESVMDAISQNPNFVLEMANIHKSIIQTLATFNSQKNSEDGIRDVFLYLARVNNDAITFFQEAIKGFLLYEDFFRTAPHSFSGTHTHFGEEVSGGAMMKPYTMIQIANTLLPPQIMTRDNLTFHADNKLVTELLKKPTQCKHTDLLPVNSFCVLARIYDDRIHFVLNKVIEVPTDDGMQKSTCTTAKEHILKLDNILDLACESVWNRIQAIDEGLGEYCQQKCAKHSSVALIDWSSYTVFKMNFKAAFGSKKRNNVEALDASISISINDCCSCTVMVTPRLIQDIGLKPAIEALAATVASSVASNSIFGHYNVSTLIVIDGISKQKDTKIYNPVYFTSILRKKMHASLQAHSKRPTVIFGIAELVACCNYLGSWGKCPDHIIDKSIYRQVSSTGYIIEIFSPDVSESYTQFEVYQIKSNYYQKLKYSKRELLHIDIPVLKRGDSLNNSNGVTTKIMFQGGKSYSIGVYATDGAERPNFSEGVARKYLHTFPCPKNINRTYPLALKIYFQNYSATVKVEMSWIASKFIRGRGLSDSGYVQIECHQSFTAHERLTLKQKD